MKIISTKAHGVIDYLMGALLMVAPWLFMFGNNGAETWIPVALGAGAIVYSICTDYEMGPVKAISMRTHLNLDTLSGIFLAVSPWLFGFYEHIYLPHLILGIAEIGAVLLTDSTPYRHRAKITNLKAEH